MPSRWVKTATGWVQLDAAAAGLALSNYPAPLSILDDVQLATTNRANTALTAPATPHTLAAATTQLYASTSAAAGGLLVCATVNQTGTNATDTRALLHIYLGAAGVETLWASVPIGNGQLGMRRLVPGLIPAGSRVSARLQSAVASATQTISATLLPRLPATIGAPIVWGVNTAVSGGQVLSAPAGNGVEGVWTQVVASTPSRLCAVGIFPQCNGVTSVNATGLLLDVGVGASGAEVVIVPDVYWHLTTAEAIVFATPTTFAVDVPAGSRLAVRFARSSGSNAVDLVTIGAPWTG